jgi:GNAT superfamily N-acetyltransferase
MMNAGDDYVLVERPPTAVEYARLRAAAAWWPVDEEGISRGLGNGLYEVVITHKGEAVACGRVTGDGGLYFYLSDVIVLPDYRGRGLGPRVMAALMAYIARTARPGAFVALMAARGVQRYYEQWGFKARPAGRPGMWQVWGRETV